VNSVARLLVGSGVLVLALFAQDQPPPKIEPSTEAPAGKVLEWTSAEGKPYWYRLPKKIDRARPPNLLVMLHGTGLKWGWAFWNYPIAEGSFRGNDVVVAPEGMTPGGEGIFNFTQAKPDREHIAGLITYLKKRLPIGKVYVYGHSQGAFFAYWFAGERPDLVDGIVAHAGNVLGDVKHPKAAKENVAIGILHGRADAVVSVECAYATEKVYKEQGYKKLRLYVVEGLNEQTGHWPLPKQVGEMLAWLDQASTDTARGAIEIALHELAAETTEVSVVVSAAASADRLLKNAKADEKTALGERLAAIQAVVADLVTRHAAAIAEKTDVRKADAPHGSWAAHFRAANRGLDAAPAWQASVKELRQRAATHEKTITSAAAKLEKSGASSLADAVKALEAGFLAPGYDDLLGRASHVAKSGGKAVKADDAAKLEALVKARRADAESGAEAAAAITKEAVGPIRKAHPDWFE
jgi:predicted esterase